MAELISFVTVKNALQAIEYYKEVFGAEVVGDITMMRNIPGYEDEKYKDMVGHCTLKMGESRFFINDALEDYNLEIGNNIQLVFELKDEETLKKVFNRIVEDGELVFDLEEVFWGALFGTAKDQFGIYWQLYYGHK